MTRRIDLVCDCCARVIEDGATHYRAKKVMEDIQAGWCKRRIHVCKNCWAHIALLSKEGDTDAGT